MNRRDALKSAAALAASGFPLVSAAAAPAGVPLLGPPERFDYARLKGRARALAAAPYQAPSVRLPAEVQSLDYDHYQMIAYNKERALWAREGLAFRLAFFHLGLYFRNPVAIHEVSDGVAREIAYDPALFDYGRSGLRGTRLPRDLGFAGLRVFFRDDWKRDVAAFLGASYFRAVGGEMQYGISARGLAVDAGLARAEEFPSFTRFWIERPRRNAGRLTLYALLDSSSIAGAYRFDIIPSATLVIEVDAALYPRTEMERLGIAPLTSMYYCGENDRRMADDWRSEIHDSDGLSMWTGSGEWIWRPLVNPASLRFNAFADDSPKGFGLLQRDRDFDHYQDDGAFYERRPSLWVEPRSAWGKGSVQLMELPAVNETFDNVVAFWNPVERPKPGQELLFSYRLHWGSRMPRGTPLAQVVATRTGIGGVVGRPREHFSWRFVVDFAGGSLAKLGAQVDVEPVITLSRGTVEIPSARPLRSIQGYRASFDVRPEAGAAPVDLRLFLRTGGQALTETWIYQWTPPAGRSLYPP